MISSERNHRKAPVPKGHEGEEGDEGGMGFGGVSIYAVV
jgi:hypothetical protein